VGRFHGRAITGRWILEIRGLWRKKSYGKKKLTSRDLEAIRNRCNEATSGPWYASEKQIGHVMGGAPFVTIADCCAYDKNKEANARFIAHARTDILDLLDLIEELKKEMIDDGLLEFFS
jgi:hypothetical protein